MVKMDIEKVAEWPDGSFIGEVAFSLSVGRVIAGSVTAHCGPCDDDWPAGDRLGAFVFIHDHQIRHLGEELAAIRAQLEALIHGKE